MVDNVISHLHTRTKTKTECLLLTNKLLVKIKNLPHVSTLSSTLKNCLFPITCIVKQKVTRAADETFFLPYSN